MVLSPGAQVQNLFQALYNYWAGFGVLFVIKMERKPASATADLDLTGSLLEEGGEGGVAGITEDASFTCCEKYQSICPRSKVVP